MNTPTFGSLDNLEDAIDLLNKTQQPYVLVFGQTDDKFRVCSSLGDSKDKVIGLMKSKEMKQIIDYNEL